MKWVSAAKVMVNMFRVNSHDTRMTLTLIKPCFLRIVFSGRVNLAPTSYFKKNYSNINIIYAIVKQFI